jgi:acyl-CoA thioester hydrolase
MAGDPNCPSGVCGADVPPLIGSLLTGTGLTLDQAAAAIERGESPPLSELQRGIVEEHATGRSGMQPRQGYNPAPVPAGYPHSSTITTRWKDNDVYGHVNNVEYYSFFDTVINAWLIREGGLDIHRGDVIGVCAESHCAFKAAVEFPDAVVAGLRVGHLGNRSVRYEIGLFRDGAEEEPIAEGWFVHVFVTREDRRPVAIPPAIRTSLERLQAEAA